MIKSLNNLVDEFEALKTAFSACHRLSSSYFSQNNKLPEREIRFRASFNSYFLETSEYYARAFEVLVDHVANVVSPILSRCEPPIREIKELSDLLIELQADNFSFHYSFAESFDDLGLKGHLSDVVFDLIQQSKQLSDSLADVDKLVCKTLNDMQEL